MFTDVVKLHGNIMLILGLVFICLFTFYLETILGLLDSFKVTTESSYLTLSCLLLILTYYVMTVQSSKLK